MTGIGSHSAAEELSGKASRDPMERYCPRCKNALVRQNARDPDLYGCSGCAILWRIEEEAGYA